MTDQTITLYCDQADDLAYILDLVEDWLAHTGDDVLDELADFGADPLGRGGVELFIDALGRYSVTLHRLTTRASAHPEGGHMDTRFTHTGDSDTVAVDTDEPALLGRLLTDVDEFLRTTPGAAELLAGFYATHRGEASPRFAAGTLIDLIGFTGLRLRGDTATLPVGKGDER